MPVYCYSCNECGADFEVRHSMSFEDQRCTSCDSPDVFKVPALSLSKASKFGSSRPGKIVDEYIQDVKKELRTEKKNLKAEEL
jgi:putative FmdB family regulatory protein